MEPVRPTTARHQPTGELVDDDHLAVLDDVLPIEFEQGVSPQRLIDRVQNLGLRRIPQVLDAEDLFDPLHPALGEGGGLGLLVHQVIPGDLLVAVLVLDLLTLCQLGNDAIHLVVEIDGHLGRAGDDERRPGLVHQDRVHLVDDGVDVGPLHHPVQRELHVVPQVVESELVVGPVGDVGGVGLSPLVVLDFVLDTAHREPEEPVDPAHPVGIAARQVIVHRDHVDTPPGEGVEGDRQGRHEGLPFPGLHLRDPALVKHDAAHELNVEVTHAGGPFRDLANDGENLHQLLVQHPLNKDAALASVLGEVGRRLSHTVPNHRESRPQRVVIKHLHLGFSGVDGLDDRAHPLEVPLVLGAEDGFDALFDQIHVRSLILRRGGAELRWPSSLQQHAGAGQNAPLPGPGRLVDGDGDFNDDGLGVVGFHDRSRRHRRKGSRVSKVVVFQVPNGGWKSEFGIRNSGTLNRSPQGSPLTAPRHTAGRPAAVTSTILGTLLPAVPTTCFERPGKSVRLEHVVQRVDRRAVHVDLVVKVGSVGPPRVAQGPHRVSPADLVPGLD